MQQAYTDTALKMSWPLFILLVVLAPLREPVRV